MEVKTPATPSLVLVTPSAPQSRAAYDPPPLTTEQDRELTIDQLHIT